MSASECIPVCEKCLCWATDTVCCTMCTLTDGVVKFQHLAGGKSVVSKHRSMGKRRLGGGLMEIVGNSGAK